MRLFIGIELPIEIKNHIATSVLPLQTTLKGWENSHDYHLTLLFIGETPPENIPSIIQKMQEVSFTPFNMTISELLFFGRRVMYLSFAPVPELLDLKERLKLHFTNNYKRETKKFIPHLTVKRWQRYEYDELKKGIEANPLEKKTFTVDHLALFKAEKDRDNRKYHILARN